MCLFSDSFILTMSLIYFSLDKKLQQIESRHKIARWQLNSIDLRVNVELARSARQKETLKKLHRESMERCHLLIIKRNARKWQCY